MTEKEWEGGGRAKWWKRGNFMSFPRKRFALNWPSSFVASRKLLRGSSVRLLCAVKSSYSVQLLLEFRYFNLSPRIRRLVLVRSLVNVIPPDSIWSTAVINFGEASTQLKVHKIWGKMIFAKVRVKSSPKLLRLQSDIAQLASFGWPHLLAIKKGAGLLLKTAANPFIMRTAHDTGWVKRKKIWGQSSSFFLFFEEKFLPKYFIGTRITVQFCSKMHKFHLRITLQV